MATVMLKKRKRTDNNKNHQPIILQLTKAASLWFSGVSRILNDGRIIFSQLAVLQRRQFYIT